MKSPCTPSHLNVGTNLRLLLIAGLSLSLSGCIIAVPTSLKVISIAADGISLLATGKTTTDHMISQVAGKDCAMTRALTSEDVCTENKVDIALADEEVVVDETKGTKGASLASIVEPKALP